jgi:Family of unknown function (DUF6169)
MSILLPYSFTYNDGKYSFLTDNSVVYNVEFTDGSYYFFDLPADVPVFELNIKALNAAESIIQPYDKRVEITIVNILSKFFDDNKNSLIYVCNNLDNRERARSRKFNSWFNKNATFSVEKYDINFTMHNIIILASLIVHTENIRKDELIKRFFDLYR